MSGFHTHKLNHRHHAQKKKYTKDWKFTYTFESFFHPFVDALTEQLNRKSLPGLFDPVFHEQLRAQAAPFEKFYQPLPTNGVDFPKKGFPSKEIDVSDGGPYAVYNWELLYHMPLTIAVHLSKNQRFSEAQRWFHYIFDPTSTDESIPAPARYWKFLAFRNAAETLRIEDILELLSTPDSEITDDTKRNMKRDALAGYSKVQEDPFHPHVVARTRKVAYQYNVIMKYLDNLIAWGDSLFLQDTMETINEATQIYILAANLLGQRPQRVPSPGSIQARTFAQLKEKKLGEIGDAWVELEANFPFDSSLPPDATAGSDKSGALFGIGRALYFCIPQNEKILGYWDTVADRLFKIRHCMNIEGVVRQLALYEPWIDPGMLVKAAAAGIDVTSIVSGLSQPAGPVRASVWIQKALELCAEVRNLGSALLSALEKGDAERLALLRQRQETAIHQLTQDVRHLQWKQAEASTEALLRSRASALERYRYYQRLLGLAPDAGAAPDTFPIDRATSSADLPRLTETNFDEAYAALVGRYDKPVAAEILPPIALREEGKLRLSVGEFDDLNRHADDAQDARTLAERAEETGSVLAAIPMFDVKMHWFGIGASASVAGGQMLSSAARAIGTYFANVAQKAEKAGQNANKKASFERRADDWILQNNLAAKELMQIGRQIIASLISEQITHHEYHVTRRQIEQSQELDRVLSEKFTSEQLYAWMQGEIARLYYEYYRFAFDTARRAEQAMKRDLMRPEVDAVDYIKFNYWDGGRKGLLAGEALYLDVKRLEMARIENDKREYELTKSVSLLQVDPLALVRLRRTGRCTISLPEELFDMDGPGQYMRRIKSVAVTVPCVVGPYASLNCTLRLLRSSIRKDAAGSYPRSENSNFQDYFGAVQSIVTSNAQNDSGLFEPNLHDERYLPFEGSGVIGNWQIELPANPANGDPQQFDYETISDVILHVRYTAREGGELARGKAIKNLTNLIKDGRTTGSVRLFSLRHEFPMEWIKFKAGSGSPAQIELKLRPEHYPFWSKGYLQLVKSIDVLAKGSSSISALTVTCFDAQGIAMQRDAGDFNGLFTCSLGVPQAQSPVAPIILTFNERAIDDVWMALRWGAPQA